VTAECSPVLRHPSIVRRSSFVIRRSSSVIRRSSFINIRCNISGDCRIGLCSLDERRSSMYLVLLQQEPLQVPTSGYLLCFVPLALVIIGFIVAARFTDGHAIRPYMRLQPNDEPGIPTVERGEPTTNVPLPND
jgi:hypothetical protein